MDKDRAGKVTHPEVDALIEALHGQPLSFTRQDLARRTGVPTEVSAAWWRTMGFPDASDDDIAFTKDDAELLDVIEQMTSIGAMTDSTREASLRTAGRTLSRLAEWQARAMLQGILYEDSGQPSRSQIKQVTEMVRLASTAQRIIWRRHLAGAASRLLVQFSADSDSDPGCAGFVDIVGYTTRSRSMSGPELAQLVEQFESVVSDLIAEHRGRAVKTIGDEVFFVVDDPIEAAWLGTELVGQHHHDPTFPKVRVGIAFGDLHHRLGDVLGPVVNMASRLTTVARPGGFVVDPAMAAMVKGTPGLRLRRMRRVSIKGFDLVDPWSVRTDRGVRPGLRGAIDHALEDARDDIAMRLPKLGL
jgi:adenylate cyclase